MAGAHRIAVRLIHLAAGAMIVALVAPRPAAAADPARFVGRPDLSIAARVQRLEDIEEIHELMYAYGRDVDTKNFAALGRLFAAKGRWGGVKGPGMIGPDGIREGMIKAFGADDWKNHFHVFTNAIIHLDGDRATAISKWQFMGPAPGGGARTLLAGHYDDVFIRGDGHWKFLRRTVINDVPSPPRKP